MNNEIDDVPVKASRAVQTKHEKKRRFKKEPSPKKPKEGRPKNLENLLLFDDPLSDGWVTEEYSPTTEEVRERIKEINEEQNDDWNDWNDWDDWDDDDNK